MAAYFVLERYLKWLEVLVSSNIIQITKWINETKHWDITIDIYPLLGELFLLIAKKWVNADQDAVHGWLLVIEKFQLSSFFVQISFTGD